MDILLPKVFDEANRHSLPVRLRELHETYLLHGPAKTHNLVGLCASFRLAGMLSLLDEFKAEPSETVILEMIKLLEIKRTRFLSGEPVSPIGSSTYAARVAEARSAMGATSKPVRSMCEFRRTGVSFEVAAPLKTQGACDA